MSGMKHFLLTGGMLDKPKIKTTSSIPRVILDDGSSVPAHWLSGTPRWYPDTRKDADELIATGQDFKGGVKPL